MLSYTLSRNHIPIVVKTHPDRRFYGNARKIRFIRMFKGWTQEEMAEKLGMALNGYAKIERGEVDINISRLNQIAEVLGIETTQLIGLNEKNVFNFIENSYNLVHNQSNGCYINQVETKHQLEKALLVIEQKDKEIAYLQEIIRLLNSGK